MVSLWIRRSPGSDREMNAGPSILLVVALTACLQASAAAAEESRPAEPTPALSLDRWRRHVVDGERPWRAVFIASADLDGDGAGDIVTGGWWYRNSGSSGGGWTRREIGEPLLNMAAVHDFDRDGDADVLGTTGKGSSASARFVWARNDGEGRFTVLDNIAKADGDFLQGIAVASFRGYRRLGVALSWHRDGRGIQMLTVPPDPSDGIWTWERISDVSQDEALSVGHIDGRRDLDLLLGTKWLRNTKGSWSVESIADVPGSPDRNRLADMNGDGRWTRSSASKPSTSPESSRGTSIPARSRAPGRNTSSRRWSGR